MADAVIAVSEGTKADILEHFDIDPAKIAVIYNGINVDQYHPTDETDALEKYGVDPEQADRPLRWPHHAPEGHRPLVNAIHYINPDAQVVLCAGAAGHQGSTLPRWKMAVKRVRQEGFKNLIWVQEMVSKAEAIQLYSHATVFCCPSIYEPFGIINLEAMACRTAVVASAVGGIKEVVIDGVTGFLVPLEQLHVAPFEPVNPDALLARPGGRDQQGSSTTRNSPIRWPQRARSAHAMSSAGRASHSRRNGSTIRC
jgi:starch synthase